MDLDQLIKETGDEVDYEFYYNGQLIQTGQTIFEILRNHIQNTHKVLNSVEKADFYFIIKDKRDDIQIARKDSLLDFENRRDRTKSEAVGDFSVSYVNQMVQ